MVHAGRDEIFAVSIIWLTLILVKKCFAPLATRLNILSIKLILHHRYCQQRDQDADY